MEKRKSISKKLRFDIFKRDEFVCQYCGSHPPSAILHVDHIHPVKEGGTNCNDNLITSCSLCNLGKSANLLTNVPISLKDKAILIKESELQIKEYSKIINSKKLRIHDEAWKIIAVLEGVEVCETYNKAQFIQIEMFIKKLGYHEVYESAEIAYCKFPYTTYNKFKYFCGICWNKSKGENHG